MKRLLTLVLGLCSCTGGMYAGKHGKPVKKIFEGREAEAPVCVTVERVKQSGDKQPSKSMSLQTVIPCDECQGGCCGVALSMELLLRDGWKQISGKWSKRYKALGLVCGDCGKHRYFAVERCSCKGGCPDCRQTRDEQGIGTRCGISLDDQVGCKELLELCHPEMSTREVNALFKSQTEEQKGNLFEDLFKAVIQKGKKGNLGNGEESKLKNMFYSHADYPGFLGKLLLVLASQKDIEMDMVVSVQLLPALQRYFEHRQNGTLSSLRCSREYVAARCFIENFFIKDVFIAENTRDTFALLSCLIKKDSIENAALRTCYDCIVVNADSYYERVCTDLKLLFKDVPNGAQRARELATNKVKSIYAGDHMDELLEFKNNPKSCFHTFKNEIKQDLEQGRLKNVSVRTTSNRDLDNAAYLMASSAVFLSMLALNKKS